ncbi:MAG: putative DNA binding domain-containing protein [Anaerolineae bacterium]|nr:putative DNA binding domain-containing protein [Anaerolineae bacterium]
MDRLELYEMIAGGEDSLTEFKRDVSQRSDFAGEMIAFANTEGGQILVGVADDGMIVGVSDPQRTEETLMNIARDNCTPPLTPVIERVATDEGVVLVVYVPRRVAEPHENNSGQCYIRVGSTKRLVTAKERARLLQQAGLVHYDEIPVPRTEFTDLDLDVFGEYYRRIYNTPLEKADVPLPRMLENMRFIVRDIENVSRLSLAGLLLFGKRPQEFVRYARISAVRWQGISAGEVIVDRQEIEGRLPQQIEQAESFVVRNTFLETRIEGMRQTDRAQYPIAAFREAIVNAVAHRDYSLEGAQTLLYIFDDRIEIRSPGILPNSVTLDNIRTHYSKPRNDTIARVLFNLGYVNVIGSGVPRIINLMRANTGRDPEFEELQHQFLVRLWGAHRET